jgi:hypothetical protein
MLAECNDPIGSPIVQVESFMCLILDGTLLDFPIVTRIGYLGAHDAEFNLKLAQYVVIGSTEV